MSKLSHHHACVEPVGITKGPQSSKDGNKIGQCTKEVLSGSCGDISELNQRHSQNTLNREDSVSSKSSFSSIFPNLMKSFDNSSGFTINQSFIPRPEKTLHLFKIILSTLKDLHKKYSLLTNAAEGSDSILEESQICSKVDKRIMMIESMKDEYESMMEEKEVELKRIEETICSVKSSKNGKEDIDMLDCENYWTICREMCVAELKLERCCGKLQFQIMNLESVSRVSSLDQYELAIRLNDISKFKTRIKIEKGGHQVWDNTTFILTPSVDDILDIKFCELKTLNKALILLERKLSSVNNLILADTSIFTFWLTPLGTIKLQVIVQWNAVLDDPDLIVSLSQLDNKYSNIVVKDGIVIRSRANSTSNKYSQNRLSVNFGHLFRSDALDRISPRGSMENIAENVDEDRTEKVNLRKRTEERTSAKTKACYHENLAPDDIHIERRTSESTNLNINTVSAEEIRKDVVVPRIVADESFYVNYGATIILESEVVKDIAYQEPRCDELNVKKDECNDYIYKGNESGAVEEKASTIDTFTDNQKESIEVKDSGLVNSERIIIGDENVESSLCENKKVEENVSEQEMTSNITAQEDRIVVSLRNVDLLESEKNDTDVFRYDNGKMSQKEKLYESEVMINLSTNDDLNIESEGNQTKTNIMENTDTESLASPTDIYNKDDERMDVKEISCKIEADLVKVDFKEEWISEDFGDISTQMNDYDNVELITQESDPCLGLQLNYDLRDYTDNASMIIEQEVDCNQIDNDDVKSSEDYSCIKNDLATPF